MQSINFIKQTVSEKSFNTGVIQLIPPVLSSETLLHILLSSEYSGFRPSTTAVVTQPVNTRKSGSQSNLQVLFLFFSAIMCC